MICGSSTSERARPARLRIPPEISPGNLFSSPVRPTRSSFSMTMLRISLSFFLVCSREGESGVVIQAHRAEQGAVLEHHTEQRADLVELLGRALDDVGAVDDDLAAFRPHQGVGGNRAELWVLWRLMWT